MVTRPTSPEPKEPTLDTDDDGDSALRDATILVVDDDPANRLAIEAALGDLADRLVMAESGDAALRKLLEQDFALILLDVQMPGLDGFETARVVRSRLRNQTIPIIFVTAYSKDDKEILRGYELGAVDFLFKPIVPEVLRAKASVFVQLREQAQKMAQQSDRLRIMEREQHERELEQQRKQAQAELLRRERDEQLRINARLEETDRQKDRFIAVLAHELRNPLAPLVTGLEIFEDVDFANPEHTRVREAMSRQVRTLNRLVDDLLDVSRIASGKIVLQPDLIDLREVCRQAVNATEGAAAARFQDLKVEIPETEVLVNGDAVRLGQVVSNLLSNAVRYTPTEGWICVSLRVEGDEAAIAVEDTGRGLEAEAMSRIFEMFVQEREGGEGLGLGLTLVKNLVEMHGGTVSCTSEGRGLGSRFEVRIPMAVENEKEAPAAVEQDAEPTQLSVGLIEDEADIRDLVEALFTAWGHTVVQAANGRAGIEMVEAHDFDVVFVDIGLPGIDGYEVARRLSELGDKKPFLVAMTGYGQANDRAKALEAGFDHHVTKPASSSDLKAALRASRQNPS